MTGKSCMYKAFYFCSMDHVIEPASKKDLPEIVNLVNSAYRGDSAKQGWTHEADLIDGTWRTDVASLSTAFEDPSVLILKYVEQDMITGCVYLEKQNTTLYLGMLTVAPRLQAKGTGRLLLKASELYAREAGCHKIEMTVISARQELIAWYERNGYIANGETRPFHTDKRFGIPKQNIEFIVMEKSMLV